MAGGESENSTPTGVGSNFKGQHLGLVLSGGGSRAAYQVGVLKALSPHLATKPPISVITGSSVGAINGILLGAWLKHGLKDAVATLEMMWMERTFRTTFLGHPSRAFIRALQVAFLQYLSPGPQPTTRSIFDPTPLMTRVDEMIEMGGGIEPERRSEHLKAVAVMTTLEGPQRRGLLFASCQDGVIFEDVAGVSFDFCVLRKMSASHAFASAALPWVLPPVNLNLAKGQVRLVDGGIADNIPVDPAVRLGADELIVIDNSGRRWWLDRVGKPHYTQEPWELLASTGSFCRRPLQSLEIRNTTGFGPLLKDAVGRSLRDFMTALGPTWPIFKILNNKLGEDVAYEVLSYCALHPEYMHAIIEKGAKDALAALSSSNAKHIVTPVSS